MVDSHPRSPLDQVLDAVLFGPIGLALTACNELPAMIEKGRQRIVPQVMLARMIGEHAAKQGQRMAKSAVKGSTETLVGLGIIPAGPRPPATEPVPARPAAGSAAARRDRAAPDRATAPAAPAAAAPTGSANGRPPATAVPVSDDLAIPGYDSLSASQVVQRLAGLAPDELEAVRGYEAAGRGRRTILNKIAQLQSGPA